MFRQTARIRGILQKRLYSYKHIHLQDGGQLGKMVQPVPWRITALIIHQIFSLARDWPKGPSIPQLKLGNIREYSPILKIARVAKKI